MQRTLRQHMRAFVVLAHVSHASSRFMALDTAHNAGAPVTRQLASAFECALLDIWSQAHRPLLARVF